MLVSASHIIRNSLFIFTSCVIVEEALGVSTTYYDIQCTYVRQDASSLFAHRSRDRERARTAFYVRSVREGGKELLGRVIEEDN